MIQHDCSSILGFELLSVALLMLAKKVIRLVYGRKAVLASQK